MPNVLSDPPTALYAILAVAFIVALAVWYRRRNRKSLVAVLVTGGLLLALFLIDWAYESPREESTRRVEAMAAAANAADGGRFVENLSPAFAINGKNRDAVRNSGVWNLIRQHSGRVAVWGHGKGDFVERGDNEVEIGFYLKAEAPGFQLPAMWYARANFIRDLDGQFRARGIKFYLVQEGHNQEVSIPNFP